MRTFLKTWAILAALCLSLFAYVWALVWLVVHVASNDAEAWAILFIPTITIGAAIIHFTARSFR